MKHISKNNDADGRQIWETVRRAADQTPNWVKGNVVRASTETVNEIASKQRAKKQQSESSLKE